MSVVQNVTFDLKQDGLSETKIDERVAGALKLVYMAQHAKRRPH